MMVAADVMVAAVVAAAGMKLRHKIIRFPTSLGVSEVSERASEQTNERTPCHKHLHSVMYIHKHFHRRAHITFATEKWRRVSGHILE